MILRNRRGRGKRALFGRCLRLFLAFFFFLAPSLSLPIQNTAAEGDRYTVEGDRPLPYLRKYGKPMYLLIARQNGLVFGPAFCVQPGAPILFQRGYRRTSEWGTAEQEEVIANIVYLAWLRTGKSDRDYARAQIAIWTYLDPEYNYVGFPPEEMRALIDEAKRLREGPDFGLGEKPELDFSGQKTRKLEDRRGLLAHYELSHVSPSVRAAVDGKNLSIKKVSPIQKGDELILRRKGRVAKPIFLTAEDSQDVMICELPYPGKLRIGLTEKTEPKGTVSFEKKILSAEGETSKIRFSEAKFALRFLAPSEGGKAEYKGRLLRKGEEVLRFSLDAHGKASLNDLPLGDYDLVEIGAPGGLGKNETGIRFSLREVREGDVILLQRSENGHSALEQLKKAEDAYCEELKKNGIAAKPLPSASVRLQERNAAAAQRSVHFYDRLQYGYLRLEKEKEAHLTGAEGSLKEGDAAFTLLGSDGKAVDQLVTDKNGLAYSRLLPLGTYTLRQTKGAPGYRLLPDQKIELTEEGKALSLRLQNPLKKISLRIVKTDRETKGRIPIAGVQFRLYTSAEGGVPLTFGEGKKESVFETDRDGCAYFPEALTYGRYYLEEIKAPAGYFLDPKQGRVPVDINDTAVLLEEKTLSYELENQPQKAQLEIHKRGKVLDSFIVKEYSLGELLDRYDIPEEARVQSERRGAKEETEAERAAGTSRFGSADSTEKATSAETSVGSEAKDAAEAGRGETGENGVSLPDAARRESVGENETGGRTIKESETVSSSAGHEGSDSSASDVAAGASLTETSTPETTTPERTRANGSSLLTESEKNGAAELLPADEEGETSSGMTILSSGTAKTRTGESAEAALLFEEESEHKKYRCAEPVYREIDLPGAEFTLRAEEDIYSPSLMPGSAEKKLLLYKKGEVVAKLESRADGPVRSDALPLGRYSLEETKVPEGFVKGTKIDLDLRRADEKVNIQLHTERIENRRQKLRISLTKHFEREAGIEEEVLRRSTLFALCLKQDLKVGAHLVPAGTILELLRPDGNGKIETEAWTEGSYELRELYTHRSYELNDPLNFELHYEAGGEKADVVRELGTVENKLVKKALRVYKCEKDSERPLAGVEFRLYRENKGRKEALLDLKTDAAGKIEVDGLTAGHYFLEEVHALPGYLRKKEMLEWEVERGSGDREWKLDNEPTEIYIHKKDLGGEELPGAEMELRNDKGEILEKWISGHEPHRLQKLELGKRYVLHENLAPLGYATASAIEFVFSEELHKKSLTMTDAPIQVRLKKVDAASGLNLLGATLALYDAAGREIRRYQTGEEDELILGLHVGEQYCLKELTPPEGYKRAEPLYFVVKDQAEVQIFTMTDEKSELRVEKIDEENGENLAGAELEIVDEAGKVLASFRSQKEATLIHGLAYGKKYILRERKAPPGYICAAPLEFVMKEGEDKELRFKNRKSKIRIEKQDAETGELLSGAKFALKTPDGKILHEWESAAAACELRGLVQGERYILEEIRAPEGYIKGEPLSFTLEKGEGESILFKNEKRNIPKTGEERERSAAAAALLLCCPALCVVRVRRKRKKE